MALALALFAHPPVPEAAPAQTILRDTESELLLQHLAAPLYRVAEVDRERLRIFISDEAQFNAFATETQLIVLAAGLIDAVQDPAEVQGVIAHEIGHIAGGHHVSGKEAEERAAKQFLLSTAAGLLLAGATGSGDALVGSASIGHEVALKGVLAHHRVQEQAADQAAVNYMKQIRRNPRGLLQAMRRIQAIGEIMGEGSPYLRTHPLGDERVNFLERAVEQSPYPGTGITRQERESLRRVQAKLLAYRDPKSFRERHGQDNASVAARYGLAVATWREGKVREAVDILEQLIAREPENPFYHELLGQVLHESADFTGAVAAYTQAVRLMPDAPLLRLGKAIALLKLGARESTRAAVRELRIVRDFGESPGLVWRLLTIAHDRLGETGRASLALAELRLLEGAHQEAVLLAQRALTELPPESEPARLRASDILAVLGETPDDPNRTDTE